jgi:hypothetical protein
VKLNIVLPRRRGWKQEMDECIREAIFGIKMTYFYIEMTVNQKDRFLIWRLRFAANLQICFKFAD